MRQVDTVFGKVDWTQGGSKSNQLFQDDVSKSELQASKKLPEVSTGMD